MKIAILGFAGQGQSSYDYWNDGTNEITICDRDADLQAPDGVATRLGPDNLKGLDEFDLLIRTPSLHPKQIVEANPDSPNILAKVTSNTNEFLRVCPTKNVIGVTGTKGKGTTSTLITHMLRAAGKTVHLGGNIGIPPLVMLGNDIQPDHWVVLELANFQLIDAKYSPPTAVVLMVEAEHLDWHEDMEEYIAAKQQLFIHQKPEDIAIYYGRNEISESIAGASEGQLIPFMEQPGAIVENGSILIDGQPLCRTDELKLLGEHNWQNACAAATAVWQHVPDRTAIATALTSFTGLPFRIEYRQTVNHISYYNDSFATGGGATSAAIKSIPEMKVMIIGGFDRYLDLTNFSQVVNASADSIRKVLLIGQSAERMAENLRTAGFDNFEISKADNMPAIVAAATDLAQAGDAVVLSPGFASFDMFKNFEDRGQQFNAAVSAL